MKAFYQEVSDVLVSIVEKEFSVTVAPPLWEPPSRPEFGDLSSMVAMKLAARLRKEPLDIAAVIKNALLNSLGDKVERIDIVKPAFINIFISRSSLLEALGELLARGADFFRPGAPGKKVLIEFVSANPTGPLSIAHGRQAVVGDTLARILSFFGDAVTREYYINDAGRQIDLLVESVAARAEEIKGEDFSLPADGYQGEYVKDIARSCLKSNPDDLRGFVLSEMLSLIKDNLAALGVCFDSWISQKKIISDGSVDAALGDLKDRGLIYEKDQALWFATGKFGDDKDRVIRKADGELTYFTSDIALHKDKAERGYDSLINLWGPDHHGYIARVRASLRALGYSDEILDIIIIQLVTIKTKERMSRRRGTAILLSGLIDEVGRDAARFYYVSRRNSSLLEFNIDLAKEKNFNNLLYYIQYACARIESIFRKSQIKNPDTASIKYLNEADDLGLLRVLLQFFYCLEKAYYSREPVFIIEYLKSLSAVLHKFYERQRVLGEDNNLTLARLSLLRAVKIVLHCALELLGIIPAEKM